MIAFVLHAVLVGGLVTVAAYGLERVGGLLGKPRRWVWFGALVLSIAIPMVALIPAESPAEGAAGSEAPVPEVSAAQEFVGPVARIGAWDRVRSASSDIVMWLERAEEQVVAWLPRPFGEARLVWASWLVLSLGMMVSFIGGVLCVAGWRREWIRARVRGRDVRISDGLGPAVVGLVRPEIVLPRWLLALEKDTLGIVMLHESEHLTARDTLLLATGIGALMLMPWNPFVWIQLRRLRLAVEYDCDRRVLSHGVARHRYGQVLLRVADRNRATLLPVLALAESPTLLERRMKAMLDSKIRFRRTKAVFAAAGAVAVLVVACQMEQVAGPEGEVSEEARAPVHATGGELEKSVEYERLFLDMKLGESISVRRADGTTTEGMFVRVRYPDGRHVPALYRGPRKLADNSTDGTLIFEPGHTSRVREFEPADRVIPSESHRLSRTGGTSDATSGSELSGGPRTEGQQIAPHVADFVPGGRSVQLADGSIIRRYVFLLRREDGTLVPGEFRGPSKLAYHVAELTGGIVDVGSEYAYRVRELEPGARIIGS